MTGSSAYTGCDASRYGDAGLAGEEGDEAASTPGAEESDPDHVPEDPVVAGPPATDAGAGPKPADLPPLLTRHRLQED